MLDREDIDEELQRILNEKGESEDQLVRRIAPDIVRWLRTLAPDFWKCYGPYWWNLMDLLKRHAPSEFASYARGFGGEELLGRDDEVKSWYDYGSDAANYVAAAMYIELRVPMYGPDSTHTIETPDGETKEYIPGVGFVDESDW